MSPDRVSPLVAVVSFRLGGADGVSVEAAKWVDAFRSLGCRVRTVAGSGRADVIVPGLRAPGLDDDRRAPAPDRRRLASALADATFTVVENLCSLPLNPQASELVAATLAGRPAILRHHDLPWERERFIHAPPPPDDPAWAHVTINRGSEMTLRRCGIAATTLYNTFDPDPPPGDRAAVRAALGVPPDRALVLQPTRAIARKQIATGLAVAERLDGTFWLSGAAEEGYADELATLLGRARVPVHHGRVPPVHPDGGMEHAYAAADLVVFPSTTEGFGNPPVEASLAGRPVAVGPYEVGHELADLGFDWLSTGRPDEIEAWLRTPDLAVLARNRDVARRHLSTADLPARLCAVAARIGVHLGPVDPAGVRWPVGPIDGADADAWRPAG